MGLAREKMAKLLCLVAAMLMASAAAAPCAPADVSIVQDNIFTDISVYQLLGANGLQETKSAVFTAEFRLFCKNEQIKDAPVHASIKFRSGSGAFSPVAAQRRCGDVERGWLLPVFLRAPGQGHLLWRVHGRYFLRGTADQGRVRVDDAQHAGGDRTAHGDAGSGAPWPQRLLCQHQVRRRRRLSPVCADGSPVLYPARPAAPSAFLQGLLHAQYRTMPGTALRCACGSCANMLRETLSGSEGVTGVCRGCSILHV